jgi:cellulose synthase/poly-beta-1,6-N-acetylglucosamine synthase-like glycosyltransferase
MTIGVNGSEPIPAVMEAPAAQESSALDEWIGPGASRSGARHILSLTQTIGLSALIALTLLTLLRDPRATALALVAVLTYIYLATGIHKTKLMVQGARAVWDGAMQDDATGHMAADNLPRYTVLVPLYHEGRILPTLIKRLSALEYPDDRLDILLLVEADDAETSRALAAQPLPMRFTQVVVPTSALKTKPRALNYGLARAQGDFLVVYDAEDAPEPDQLRKAAAAFRLLPKDVACLQARLAFYNARQALVARLFAIDYAVWFELLLPGLTRSSAFVPLGGTSNHFRIEVLRQLSGWDPYNVTEDCDLGARMGRLGWRVAMLDSTTWEEAVTRVRPWIRQRSRWVKGYLQTYLVHMQHPARLCRELGLASFLDFQLLVGGSCLSLLINPLMWGLTLLYAFNKGNALGMYIESLFPPAVYLVGLLCLVFGNFIFFYVNIYVCVRRGYLDLVRYAVLGPLYWALMSAGAWMGLLSLIFRPFYWAKTEHGASLERRVIPQVGARTVVLPSRPALAASDAALADVERAAPLALSDRSWGAGTIGRAPHWELGYRARSPPTMEGVTDTGPASRCRKVGAGRPRSCSPSASPTSTVVVQSHVIQPGLLRRSLAIVVGWPVGRQTRGRATGLAWESAGLNWEGVMSALHAYSARVGRAQGVNGRALALLLTLALTPASKRRRADIVHAWGDSTCAHCMRHVHAVLWREPTTWRRPWWILPIALVLALAVGIAGLYLVQSAAQSQLRQNGPKPPCGLRERDTPARQVRRRR